MAAGTSKRSEMGAHGITLASGGATVHATTTGCVCFPPDFMQAYASCYNEITPSDELGLVLIPEFVQPWWVVLCLSCDELRAWFGRLSGFAERRSEITC